MIKHIVMFRLDGKGKEEAARRFKEAIEALPAVIPQLKSAEVGIDQNVIDGNWDIVLTAECLNGEDLATYSAHPAHLDCVAIIKPLLAGRACVDYEA